MSKKRLNVNWEKEVRAEDFRPALRSGRTTLNSGRISNHCQIMAFLDIDMKITFI